MECAKSKQLQSNAASGHMRDFCIVVSLPHNQSELQR